VSADEKLVLTVWIRCTLATTTRRKATLARRTTTTAAGLSLRSRHGGWRHLHLRRSAAQAVSPARAVRDASRSSRPERAASVRESGGGDEKATGLNRGGDTGFLCVVRPGRERRQEGQTAWPQEQVRGSSCSADMLRSAWHAHAKYSAALTPQFLPLGGTGNLW
jgi:hypothetical protein